MKKFVAMLLVAAMAFSLAACGGSSDGGSTSDGAGAAGVTATTGGDGVTFYYPRFYNVFDPSIQPDYDYALWYSTLWCMDYDACSIDGNTGATYTYLEAAGDVADSWEVASDFSTITVKIKSGVKFQTLDSQYDYYGGRELTASDVAYSYNRLIGQADGLAVDASDYGWHAEASGDASGNAMGGGTLDILAYAEATDDSTVVFHMASADETSVNTLMTLPINLCGPEWDTLSEAQQNDWHYACGTGAFILTNYVQDQSMTFTKNPDYYGTVNVDNVTLVYIGDNTTITSQLEGGSLDWVGEKSSQNVLTLDQINALASNSSLVQYDYAGSAPMGIGLRVTQEPYSNLDFRIALQQLINMDDVLAYQGMSGSPIISGLWNVNSSWSAHEKIQAELADDYAYDYEGALEVIKSYGYSESNPLEMIIASSRWIPLVMQI